MVLVTIDPHSCHNASVCGALLTRGGFVHRLKEEFDPGNYASVSRLEADLRKVEVFVAVNGRRVQHDLELAHRLSV